jgi:hypothetical protein
MGMDFLQIHILIISIDGTNYQDIFFLCLGGMLQIKKPCGANQRTTRLVS